MRVTWKIIPKYESERFQNKAKQLKLIEAALSQQDSTLGEEVKNALEQKMNAIKADIKAFESPDKKEIELLPFYNDIFINDLGLQVRVPRKAEFLAKFVFPEEQNIKKENLVQTFLDTSIVIKSPSVDPRVKGWIGVDPNIPAGKYSATITDELPESFVRFRMPPVGRMRLDWASRSIWHPIDQLMSASDGTFSVVGREMVDGKELIRVERVAPFVNPDGHRIEGLEELLRGWVDPMRGYLPVKIERIHHSIVNGKSVGSDNPSEIISVSHISITSEGGFYPMSGVRRHREDRVDRADKNDDSMYTFMSESWNVEQLKCNVAMSSDGFRLEFG